MKLFSLVVCAVATVSFTACSNDKKETGETTTPAFSLDSAKAQIAASNANYGDGFAKGDSSMFLSKYTKDGCIMPANAPRLCGKEQITAFYKGGLAMGIGNIKLTTDEVMGGPEVVVETGKYELLSKDGATMDKGKFVVAWKQEDGKWKMHRDIWTTDTPMPAPAKK
jgi:uncharacterized protein (TIGR02246 family)